MPIDDNDPNENFCVGVSRRIFLGLSTAVIATTFASSGEATPNGGSSGPHRTRRAAEVVSGAYVMNGLHFNLCAKTGGLTRLAYGDVGTILEAADEMAGIIAVGYPTAEFAPLLLEPRFSHVEVSERNGELTLTWEKLGASRPNVPLPTGAVRATVKIRSAPDGRSVICTARVENTSQGDVAQILFPDFCGLRPFDEPERMELRMALGAVNPFAGPALAEERSPFYAPALWQEYKSEGAYHRNALRWMDYGSLTGGLSVFEKQWMTEPRPGILMHRSEADSKDLRVAWQHKVRLKPGEVWESAEFWLTPHRGGWAKGIEVYRSYVSAMSARRETPIPDRIRRGLGFQTVWMIQSAECDPSHAAFRFGDIERIAQDAKVHGLDELVLWGWCHYGSLPIRHRSELGTVEELVRGVKSAREAGVNVSLFVSIKQLDDSFSERYGVKKGTSASWTFHPELIPAMYPFDTPSNRIDVATTNAEWQKDVYAAIGEWIDRGVTSFAWDVFDDAGSMGLIDLIRRLRLRANRLGVGASFAGEPYMATVERAAQVLDYTWCWNDYIDAAAYASVLRAPRINANIEKSARVVKMAFADGLYINALPKRPNDANGTKLISAEPELSRALKEVAPLRQRFISYFTDGRFLGNSLLHGPVCDYVRMQKMSEIGGATDLLEKFEYPAVQVSAYQLDNSLLVIVLNNGDKRRRVTLESDLRLWLPPTPSVRVNEHDRSGQVIRSSSWSSKDIWRGTTGELEPLDLAFFELLTT